MSLVNIFHCSLYGFEHTLSTQEHAGVQIIIPRLHLHRTVEQDLHPQLTLATQVCGTGSLVVSIGLSVYHLYISASHSEEVNQAAGMLLKKMSRLKSGNELYGYVESTCLWLVVIILDLLSLDETVHIATHSQMLYQSTLNTFYRQTVQH